jgi:hypothetical protein
MKAICIDNSNKPNTFSEAEWLEEGMVYTIIEIVELDLQEDKLGIALVELELAETSAPYKYYSLERFLLIPENASLIFEKTRKSIKKENKEMEIYAKNANLSSLD